MLSPPLHDLHVQTGHTVTAIADGIVDTGSSRHAVVLLPFLQLPVANVLHALWCGVKCCFFDFAVRSSASDTPCFLFLPVFSCSCSMMALASSPAPYFSWKIQRWRRGYDGIRWCSSILSGICQVLSTFLFFLLLLFSCLLSSFSCFLLLFSCREWFFFVLPHSFFFSFCFSFAFSISSWIFFISLFQLASSIIMGSQ